MGATCCLLLWVCAAGVSCHTITVTNHYLQCRAPCEVGQVIGRDLDHLAPPCCSEAAGQVYVSEASEVVQVGQQAVAGGGACGVRE